MSAALQGGDGLSDFIGREYNRLLRWIELRSNNSWDAQDIIQQTAIDFVRAVRRKPEYLASPSRARGLLYRIAQRRISDHINARRDVKSLDFDPVDDPGLDSATLAAMRDSCEKLASVLTDRERWVVTATYSDGMSDEDIADHLETTPVNVRKIRSRAIEKMRGKQGD